ncbi:hypothetical protein [Xanthobacter pseudotagetidis]|uniref:hypothetical protein n=1 Tax=Xanthobacter pseudotagetidis TaxID=3119911 RepID=UPI003729F8BC
MHFPFRRVKRRLWGHSWRSESGFAEKMDLGSAAVRDWMRVTCYNRFCAEVPDIFVGQWPTSFNRSKDHPWKLWIVDTDAERRALEQSLKLPVPFTKGWPDFRAGPDFVNAAPSRGAAFVALYPPAETGLPWIALRSMPGSPIGYRHRYIWACSDTLEEAGAHFRAFAESDPKASRYLPRDRA